MRRIIYIIFIVLVVVVLGLVGYLGYKFFTKPAAPETSDTQTGISLKEFQDFSGINQATTTTATTKTTTTTEAIPEKEINAGIFSEEKVFDYWLDEAGDIYLIKTNGQIVKGAEIISNQLINDLNQLKASAIGDKVLVYFGYPKKGVFTVFSVKDRSWTPLPAGTNAADWNPKNSTELIILSNGQLSRFDIVKKTTKNILGLNFIDIDLDWLDGDLLLVKERAGGKLENKIWQINLKTLEVKELISGVGLTLESDEGWNLFFVDGSLKLQQIKSGATAILSDFIFGPQSLTLPEKCVLGIETIYCAIPKEIGDDVVLPDDYWKRSFYSNDIIFEVKIDAKNASVKSNLFFEDEIREFDAYKLKIAQNRLYFINKIDDLLHYIDF